MANRIVLNTISYHGAGANKEILRELTCVDTNDAPEVAVVDPEMMATRPAGLTASTGMDALTHAIEGYTTKGAWALTTPWPTRSPRTSTPRTASPAPCCCPSRWSSTSPS